MNERTSEQRNARLYERMNERTSERRNARLYERMLLSSGIFIDDRKNARVRPIYIGNERRDMYGLLTKCEVKMAGYWPIFVLRVHGPRRSRGR